MRLTPKEKARRERERLAKARRRQREKEKRDRRKAREKARVERRKQKRVEKARPRNALVQWSKAVRERDGNRCAVCGATKHLNAHHVLPKERYQELMYLKKNGVSLCPMCHKFGKYSAHRNPLWFVLWLKRERPEQYAWAKRHL